ncbi:hypothetical protein HDU81_000221 [Chytriomyces hyalinus]|nr:hypothetical protein HDU81_000221 [Chytriomyces hyalinus]
MAEEEYAVPDGIIGEFLLNLSLVQAAYHLPCEEFSCALETAILVQGRMLISHNAVLFYANIFGIVKEEIAIPFEDIIAVKKTKTAFIFPTAIKLRTMQNCYTFTSFLARETAYKTICARLKSYEAKAAALLPASSGSTLSPVKGACSDNRMKRLSRYNTSSMTVESYSKAESKPYKSYLRATRSQTTFASGTSKVSSDQERGWSRSADSPMQHLSPNEGGDFKYSFDGFGQSGGLLNGGASVESFLSFRKNSVFRRPSTSRRPSVIPSFRENGSHLQSAAGSTGNALSRRPSASDSVETLPVPVSDQSQHSASHSASTADLIVGPTVSVGVPPMTPAATDDEETLPQTLPRVGGGRKKAYWNLMRSPSDDSDLHSMRRRVTWPKFSSKKATAASTRTTTIAAPIHAPQIAITLTPAEETEAHLLSSEHSPVGSHQVINEEAMTPQSMRNNGCVHVSAVAAAAASAAKKVISAAEGPTEVSRFFLSRIASPSPTPSRRSRKPIIDHHPAAESPLHGGYTSSSAAESPRDDPDWEHEDLGYALKPAATSHDDGLHLRPGRIPIRAAHNRKLNHEPGHPIVASSGLRLRQRRRSLSSGRHPRYAEAAAALSAGKEEVVIVNDKEDEETVSMGKTWAITNITRGSAGVLVLVVLFCFLLLMGSLFLLMRVNAVLMQLEIVALEATMQ